MQRRQKLKVTRLIDGQGELRPDRMMRRIVSNATVESGHPSYGADRLMSYAASTKGKNR